MGLAIDSHRAAGWSGLAAVALAFGVPLVAGLARPGYDAGAQFISELGEQGAAHGVAVSLGGFLPIGVLGLAFVVFAWASGPRSGLACAGVLCFVFVPLAYVVAAFARCDTGCPAEGSTAQAIHSSFGLLEYLGGIAGLLLFALAFRARRAFAVTSLAAALATLAGFVGMIAAPELRGAFQRLADGALFAWIAFASIQLLRSTRSLESARDAYAERIRALANVRSPALVRAFATVRREDFLGPGPWQLLRLEDLGRGYQVTPDTDPRRLYDNVLVALDPTRRLNNGEPAGLARWLDSLDLAPGEELLHVGCGVGYYTAIAALALQPGGRAVGLEIDPELARRARENLAASGVPATVETDVRGRSFDAIFVNAGATRPDAVWLDALRPEGRLLLPLTVDMPGGNLGAGWMLRVVRTAKGWSAAFHSPIGVFHCAGARDPAENDALRAAFDRGGQDRVRSLRRDAHDAAPDCWLHGVGFCLSRADQNA